MFPDDRVLVGVINRKSDLNYLLADGWYRIPQARMPDGIFAEYMAFFLSGSAARPYGASGIYYYARRQGVELAYRKELLPHDRSPKALNRADEMYYKVQFKAVLPQNAPISNATARRFAFIHTTWDRFTTARTIADLYRDNDYLVERTHHMRRNRAGEI